MKARGMKARWSLLTGGIAARRYILESRAELRQLGVLVPSSLRARTSAAHLMITVVVGVFGSLVGGIGGVAAFGFVLNNHIAAEWMPLPAMAAFLVGGLLPFLLVVRFSYVVLVVVYRRALASLAATERSNAVSSSGSVAVPGGGGGEPAPRRGG